MKQETKKQEIKDAKEGPFKLVKLDDEVIIVLGNAKISPKVFKNYAEANAYIATKPYDLIINSSCYCMEQELKAKTHEKETEKVK